MQLENLKNGLMVSCQPVPGGPMDNAPTIVALALAALAGGARALRVESLPYLRAVRAATNAPIVGIIKQDRTDTEVRITPTVEQAVALCEAGADIVAFDATRRPRPASVAALIAAIKSHGKLAMADCSDVEDARAALAAGVDLVGSTLSGYVGGPEPTGPDFELIAAMRQMTPYVIAEGRVHTPLQAAEALRRGAFCVVVGSALTRTEHATSWFAAAVGTAAGRQGKTTLGIDIGGTKMLAGLVRDGKVTAEITLPTVRELGPDAWLTAVADKTRSWRGEFDRLGMAVTGAVRDGRWSALNPATLDIPGDYPLVEKLTALFGVPTFAANDAQSAAWGEHRFGAGRNEDMVFLTVSTGIGGGIVINGRPLLGLAGHFGLLRTLSATQSLPFEDGVSGHWIAAEARAAGHETDAAGVFAAAAQGASWAEAILAGSAAKIALLCADIQLVIDPARIVIGGGIGLAPGYLERVATGLMPVPSRLRPLLAPAELGPRAGIVGIADLASSSL